MMQPAEPFVSSVKVEHAADVMIEETLSRRQEGTAISSSASEASCTLARVTLTLVVNLEETLVSEMDQIKVSEVERTLIF